MRGWLFRTTDRAFRLGAAAVPRCSITVQVEATGDSMEHDQTCTKLATLCEGDLQNSDDGTIWVIAHAWVVRGEQTAP
jgi:hypothetical protein